jgi:hypothetical protein
MHEVNGGRGYAAFFATDFRLAVDNFCARAFQPFKPPARPRVVGFRFFSETVSSTWPVAISPINFASWIGSRGLPAISILENSDSLLPRFTVYVVGRLLADVNSFHLVIIHQMVAGIHKSSTSS